MAKHKNKTSVRVKEEASTSISKTIQENISELSFIPPNINISSLRINEINLQIKDDLDFLFDDPMEIYELLTRLNQFHDHDNNPLSTLDVQNLERLRSLFLKSNSLK